MASSDQVDVAACDVLRQDIGRLRTFYGPLPSPPSDPFALCLWEALSCRTLPSRRDAALAALRRIPALTPDSVRRAPRAKLEAAVALAGSLAEQRLEAILRAAEWFTRHPDLPARLRGPLLRARRALRDLPQVGEGWAQRLLYQIAPRAICPHDAGLARVLRRLGVVSHGAGSLESSQKQALAHGAGAIERVERRPTDATEHRRTARAAAALVARTFPGDVKGVRDAFLYVTHHATVCCLAVDPHCAACPLSDGCAHHASCAPPAL